MIRGSESPNAEKETVLVKDKHGEYWFIIAICNIANTKELDPVLEEVKVIDESVASLLLSAGAN